MRESADSTLIPRLIPKICSCQKCRFIFSEHMKPALSWGSLAVDRPEDDEGPRAHAQRAQPNGQQRQQFCHVWGAQNCWAQKTQNLVEIHGSKAKVRRLT